MLQYKIKPINPHAHLFEVDLHIPRPTPEGQVVRLPAWIPGSYMIRDFARHIVTFEAFSGKASDAQAVAWRKLDKDTWALAPCEGPVSIRIEVYAWDVSVRGAHLDMHHGYFNGPCVFLQAIGHEDQPIELAIAPPDGPEYATWRLATNMPRVEGTEEGDRWAFGRFALDNYDALLDYPVEMGHFEMVEFNACGVPHYMVFSGQFHADLDRIARDLKPVCEYQIRLFGEPAPFDSYLFLTWVTGNGYGGLEHRNSTSLMCTRDDLPRRGENPKQQRDAYRTYLGLCSHEYFHSWNVKRIKPKAYTPYDLTQESYTELLWAFEGITSYYDDLSLVRTGVITVSAYLELVGQTLSRVNRGSGTDKQTVTESSFDTWTRFYKQDENASNAIVSYYGKGMLVALCLDLTLRSRSGNQKSLDDLMRILWLQYGQTGEGVPEQGIQAAAESLLGESLDEFFQLALYSTKTLPLETLLEACGVAINWQAPINHADNGGKPARSSGIYLGARLVADTLGSKVQVAFEHGAAMESGLSAGDVLVAIDNVKVQHAKLEDLLAQYQPGDVIEVHAFRDDRLMKVQVKLDVGPEILASLSLSSGELTEFGKQWLQA